MDNRFHVVGLGEQIGDKHPIDAVAAAQEHGEIASEGRRIARHDVDVLVVGETREWELVEYVQDMISSGKRKALIVIGHVLSEQAGMKLCAEWLRGFLSEVPIEFLAAAEPFWTPEHPVA